MVSSDFTHTIESMVRKFRLPGSVEELAHWYARYVSPLSLVAGFILDTLFLARRVDLFPTNALLFSYLVISAISIIFINLIQEGKIRHPFAVKILPLLPVVVQFAFGGLFSAYLALYSRSASIAVSWIFIFGIAAFMLLNERFSHFYSRFYVQISIYFTVLFSFLIFFLPVVFRTIGPFMFVLSGLVTLAVMAAFLYLLLRVTGIIERWRKAAALIAGIYIAFNGMYFTNLIPPLPLALKSGGVYHSIERQSDGSYALMGEVVPWYGQCLNYAPVYHRAPGEPVFVWSAIFAPSGLATTILHEWQWYDPVQKQWTQQSEVSFPIYGGRDGGYRGYSQKMYLQPGSWRVDVLTDYGALIGRISFKVEASSSTIPLVLRTM